MRAHAGVLCTYELWGTRHTWRTAVPLCKRTETMFNTRTCAGDDINFQDPMSLSFHPGLFGPDPHYTAQVGVLPLKTALAQGAASQCPFTQMRSQQQAAEGERSLAIVPRKPVGKLLFAACTCLQQIVRNAKYVLYDIDKDKVPLPPRDSRNASPKTRQRHKQEVVLRAWHLTCCCQTK
jgi:hypothetical protein